MPDFKRYLDISWHKTFCRRCKLPKEASWSRGRARSREDGLESRYGIGGIGGGRKGGLRTPDNPVFGEYRSAKRLYIEEEWKDSGVRCWLSRL